MRTISNILVPVDFGAPSIRVLDDAIDLARKLGARVVACHVCRVSWIIAAILGSWDDLAEAVAAAARRELDDIVRARSDKGVEIVTLIRHERSGETLREIAEEVDADLLFDPEGRLTGRGIKHRWYISARRKLEGGSRSEQP